MKRGSFLRDFNEKGSNIDISSILFIIYRAKCFIFRIVIKRSTNILTQANLSLCDGKPFFVLSKKISNDQELIQSDPTSCPQNQKGNN